MKLTFYNESGDAVTVALEVCTMNGYNDCKVDSVMEHGDGTQVAHVTAPDGVKLRLAFKAVS